MMVRAAAAGVIDFSKAKPGDPQWEVYLQVMLNEMTRQSSVDMAEMVYWHYATFATVPNLEPSSYGKLRDGANKLLDMIISQSELWNKEQLSRVQKDQVKEAVQQWENEYGSMDDPRVQQAIEATVAAVKEHRLKEKLKRQAEAAFWGGGHRKEKRKERYRGKRMGNARRT